MATVEKRLYETEVVLQSGDRMTQSEFHRTYNAMPEDYRAELIGGMVFEPSSLGLPHATSDARLLYLLEHYAAPTIGLAAASGATVIMGEEDEVQPDALLRIRPEYAGNSRDVFITAKVKSKGKRKIRYVAGAPELVAEVAHSSRAIDLHLKNERYKLAGTIEYLVLCLEPLRLYWFDLQKEQEIAADAKGILKSIVFPGLWIDGDGLLELDYKRSMRALNRGMRSSEYREFSMMLASRGPITG